MPEMSPRDEVLVKVYERIRSYATSQVGGQDAEDLMQEAILVLNHARYLHLDKAEDLLPLAITIIRNKAYELYRRNRTGQLPEEYDPPDAGHDLAEDTRIAIFQQRLEEGLLKLGERCRRIFQDKLDGYSFVEIAHRMQEPVNTIYTWDLRCRKPLRQWLKQRGWLENSKGRGPGALPRDRSSKK